MITAGMQYRSFFVIALLPLLYYIIRWQSTFTVPNSGNDVEGSKGLEIPTVYPTNVVALTKILVDIPSVSGTEQRVFHYAAAWVEAQNMTVVSQPIIPLEGHTAARKNILVLKQGATVSNVRVVLSTHLDTVPGDLGAAREADGLLYGRGSVDAKGQAASMLLATTQLNDERVATLLVCGEERDHKGIMHAHELGLDRVAIINGEPTESKIAEKQKGMAYAVVTVTGRAAHSGYPHLGTSAINVLMDVLRDLRQITTEEGNKNLHNGTTLNIGLINGGSAVNVVPDTAVAHLAWRIAEHAANVIDSANEVVRRYSGVRLDVVRSNDAMRFYVPGVARTLGTTTVAYNTDLPYYRGATSKIVLFGAGSIHQAHTVNEYIERKELERLPELYRQIAQELLEEGEGV